MPLIDPVTMSSSLGTKGAHAQPLLHPIPVDSAPASQAAQHAVPGLLLALLLVRFRALVADPVSAMSGMLSVVAVLQMGYAMLCLPVAGSQAAGRAGRKHKPGEKKKAGDGVGVGGVAVSGGLLSLLLTLLITPFLHGAMVLFGAPVLTHTAHTFLCAAHLAVLGVFPLFYVRGVDASAWAAVAGFRAPLDPAVGGLVGAVAGAWLGAVPIPLDWDREWQKWPVTILCGVYVGYALGRLLGGTVLYGKRL